MTKKNLKLMKIVVTPDAPNGGTNLYTAWVMGAVAQRLEQSAIYKTQLDKILTAFDPNPNWSAVTSELVRFGHAVVV